MPINIGPKLYHWSFSGFSVHGRRIWKPHQPCTVLPCGYRGNSSFLPPPNVPTSPTSRPGWGSTWESFAPYQHSGMLLHPRSFSRTRSLHRMSFCGMGPSGEPSKPRMSAHTGSFRGAIRPIPPRFRMLRRQSLLTAWSRRTPPMLTQTPLQHRAFLQHHDSLWTAGSLSRLPGGAAVSAWEGEVV